MKNMKQPLKISLRPYRGFLFVTRSVKVYEHAHSRIFKQPDIITCAAIDGRFSGGEGRTGIWTYLVYAKQNNPSALAHELSHVVLHVFERCGIDPREANGEPFCYLLGQLMQDALKANK